MLTAKQYEDARLKACEYYEKAGICRIHFTGPGQGRKVPWYRNFLPPVPMIRIYSLIPE